MLGSSSTNPFDVDPQKQQQTVQKEERGLVLCAMDFLLRALCLLCDVGSKESDAVRLHSLIAKQHPLLNQALDSSLGSPAAVELLKSPSGGGRKGSTSSNNTSMTTRSGAKAAATASRTAPTTTTKDTNNGKQQQEQDLLPELREVAQLAQQATQVLVGALQPYLDLRSSMWLCFVHVAAYGTLPQVRGFWHVFFFHVCRYSSPTETFELSNRCAFLSTSFAQFKSF